MLIIVPSSHTIIGAVVSHIQRIGCQPEKNYFIYTVANPARDLLNREKKKKKKSGSAPSPPPPNRVAKKMRMYFEMGTDGHRFLCFQFGIS